MMTTRFELDEFPDMRLFMSAGLRYSLGRKSYAPGFFLEFLGERMDGFGAESLMIFARDLADFIDSSEDETHEVIVDSRKRALVLIQMIEERLDNVG